jgi:hypothetical protein
MILPGHGDDEADLRADADRAFPASRRDRCRARDLLIEIAGETDLDVLAHEL